MDSIFAVYKAGSVGAKRCEAIVNAIVSDIAGLEYEECEKYGFKEYTTYSDCDGWLMVIVHSKKNGTQGYYVMRHDEKRHRTTSLDIHIADSGEHFATAYTWET